MESPLRKQLDFPLFRFFMFLCIFLTMRGNKLFKFLDQVIGIPLLHVLALLVRGKKRADLSELIPARILVVKFVALGDAVLLVPALREIRMKYPGAEITLLGTSLTEIFLKQFPEYIDRFITLE